MIESLMHVITGCLMVGLNGVKLGSTNALIHLYIMQIQPGYTLHYMVAN